MVTNPPPIKQVVEISVTAQQANDSIQAFRQEVAAVKDEFDAIKKDGGLKNLADDGQAIKKAADLLTQMRARSMEARDTIVQLSKEIRQLDAGQSEQKTQLVQQLQAARVEYVALTDQAVELGKEIKGAAEEAAKLSEEAEKASMDSMTRKGTVVAANLADAALGTNLSNLQTTVVALNDAVPTLTSGFDTFGKTLNNAFTTAGGGIQGMTSAATTFMASISPILPLTLALAAATASVTAAFDAMNKQMERGRDISRRYTDARRQQLNIESQIADAIESQDVSGILSREQQIQKELEVSRTLYSDVQGRLADVNAQIESLGTVGLDDMREYYRLRGERDELEKQSIDIMVNNIGPAMNELRTIAGSAEEVNSILAQVAADDRTLKALEIRRSTELDIQRALESGSSAQLEIRRRQIELETAAIQEILPELELLARSSVVAKDRLAEYTDDLEALGLEYDLLTSAVNDFSAGVETAATDFSKLGAQYAREIGVITSQMNTLRTGTVKSIQDRLIALDDERLATELMLSRLQELNDGSAEAAEAIGNLAARLGEINTESDFLRGDAMTAARARELDSAEKEATDALKASQKRMRDLYQTFQDTAIDVESKAADRRVSIVQDTNSKLIQAAENEARARTTAATNWMESERKAYKQFRDRELQALEDSNTKRLRMIRDGLASMDEAAENNDVVSFIRSRRDFNTRLADYDEDTATGTARRANQFLDERREAERAFALRLQDIQTQAALEREKIAENGRQKLAQADLDFEKEMSALAKRHQAQIEAEKVLLQERLVSISENYNLEEDLAEKLIHDRMALLEEEDAFTRSIMSQRNQDYLNQLDKVKNAELATSAELSRAKASFEQAAIQNTIAVMTSGFTNMIGAISSAFRTPSQSYATNEGGLLTEAQRALMKGTPEKIAAPKTVGPSTSKSFDRLRPTAFAREGVVTAAGGPTLALIGEKLNPGEMEAVVKFKQSEGLGSRLAGLGVGGTTYSATVESITINGDNITAREVEQIVRDSWSAAIKAWDS